jgi:branched-chain amino acid transport system substrate-binding protein
MSTKKRVSVALATLFSTGLIATAAWAQECEVRIGVAGPMTGGASAFGLAIKAGAEFEAAYANESGGLQMGKNKCKVKVFPFDSMYTAAGGAAASNYFASENIHVTMGPIGSPETTGFRPVGKRNGQVHFSHSYMRDVMNPEFPLGFHALQAPITWGPVLIKEAKNRFKFNSVMVIGPNDQGGTDASKQLIQLYSDQGVTATSEYFQRGTTNFAPLATRIINAKPDAVELSTVPPADATILVRQLLEAGFNGIIGSLGGTGAPPIIQGAGGIDKLKAFYWLELVPIEDPGVIKLKAEYERVMKVAAPSDTLMPQVVVVSNAMQQAMRAITAAGTDQDAEKIAAELRKLTPESRYLGKGGWRGKTLYGINQELAFPVGLGMIADGKRIGVKRVEIPAE